MNLHVVSAAALVCCLLLNGCGMHAIHGEETETPPPQTPQVPVGRFNERMKSLADQIDANVHAGHRANSYIVTSFVSLDRFSDTTAFGRLISENLIHGLQSHKWNILEFRLAKGVDVHESGEFSLTRDAAGLKDEYKVSGIITGTYSFAEGNVTVNARVIDIDSGMVISSGQAYIPADWLPEAAYLKEPRGNSMKIISDGIK